MVWYDGITTLKRVLFRGIGVVKDRIDGHGKLKGGARDRYWSVKERLGWLVVYCCAIRRWWRGFLGPRRACVGLCSGKAREGLWWQLVLDAMFDLCGGWYESAIDGDDLGSVVTMGRVEKLFSVEDIDCAGDSFVWLIARWPSRELVDNAVAAKSKLYGRTRFVCH